MDRSAKKMLRFIQTNPICKNGSCLFTDFYETYTQYAGCSEQEAMACIRFLEREGFILYGKDQHGRIVGFELEHKAYHAFQYAVMEKWQIYVIPAVVTVLTTALLRVLGWS